jgi:hypothetical protein
MPDLRLSHLSIFHEPQNSYIQREKKIISLEKQSQKNPIAPIQQPKSKDQGCLQVVHNNSTQNRNKYPHSVKTQDQVCWNGETLHTFVGCVIASDIELTHDHSEDAQITREGCVTKDGKRPHQERQKLGVLFGIVAMGSKEALKFGRSLSFWHRDSMSVPGISYRNPRSCIEHVDQDGDKYTKTIFGQEFRRHVISRRKRWTPAERVSPK